MSTFKLSDFEATSVPMELKNPKNGDGLGVFLELLGPDSAEFRNFTNANVKRRMANPDAPADIDAIVALNDELLSLLVVGWSDDEFFGGAFDRAAMLAIFKNTKLGWIRDQVNEFTDKRANFFR